jgi:hypothetical protein
MGRVFAGVREARGAFFGACNARARDSVGARIGVLAPARKSVFRTTFLRGRDGRPG